MKTKLLIFSLLSSLLIASEFDVDTADVLVKEKTIKLQQQNSTTPIEDEALQKSDPLLSTTKKAKKEKPSLLDKIITQMAEKEQTKSSTKKETKTQNKSQNSDNEVVTQDSLLDEI